MLEKVKNFISNLPARESHYSRKKQQHKKYLASNITITKLYKDFLEQNTDCKKITYSRFSDIFNYDFNIAIGYPRSDLCETCDKYNAAIKSAQAKGDKKDEQTQIANHNIHKAKADAFNSKKNEIIQSIKNDPTQVALCFDFQKNLPLPVTNVGQEYYKRQLWCHNFGVHDLKTNKATMFLYAEHYAGKGANEVISMLDWYFSNKISKDVEQLHLFADNCPAQNKNRFLWAYLQSLIDMGQFKIITISYPIPGHSRMPIDQDFSKIEKKKRVCDKVLVPSFWVDLVRQAQIKNPFDVVFVEHPLTDDLKPDGTSVVKVRDYKGALENVIKATVQSVTKVKGKKPIKRGLLEMRGIMFTKDATFGRVTMTGDPTLPLKLRKPGVARFENVVKNAPTAFSGYLRIKQAKYNDVKSLLQCAMIPDGVTFYDSIKGDGDLNGEEESEIVDDRDYDNEDEY